MGNSGIETRIGNGCLILFPLLLMTISFIINGRENTNKSIEEYALASRSFSILQASLTMISTWYCGGYLFGSVESIITEGRGLIWTQTPWAFSISLVVNGILFGDKLYGKDFITLFDPIFRKFGLLPSILVYFPSLLADILWISMSFSTLKIFISTVLDINPEIVLLFIGSCLVISIIVGGMNYQKRIGCVCCVVMIVLLIFLLILLSTSEYSNDIRLYRTRWLGEIPSTSLGLWIDEVLVVVFGGTCWQVYYQQLFSCRSGEVAFFMSIFSAFGTLFFGLITCFLGIVISTIDWSRFSAVMSMTGKESMMLGYSIRYIIPSHYQPFFVLLVMVVSCTTILSALFSSASVFSINIYKDNIYKRAVDKEVIIVWRFALIVIFLISFLFSHMIQNPYSMFTFSTEIMYFFVFPQLLLCVWLPKMVNAYGCVGGVLFGLLLRLSIGVHELGWSPWWEYHDQVPLRLLCVLVTMVLEVVISVICRHVIETLGYTNLDVLKVFSSGKAGFSHKVKGGKLRSHSLKIIDM